ncbi:hypothetical protein EV644_10315 [Kribbella orskensis]|uniref:Uncharacterized protein n=1 Tax=Kribbella orskensis TaxID=2512216 RepID=A0ABY2BPD4_9ACTN|nr:MULTISPECIES: hypothetical protein [Kribbella]TCN39897.1 hypothetical protein EV642_106405 [Kribbella sp. VKM Ac-2500]TCO27320.1 hypothetical protein EV644_10315 [Kribbella orskensis]
MTDSAVRPELDLRSILGLDLPAHVVALVDDGCRSAWLIGHLHCGNGWIALIQYTDAGGHELTRRVPFDQLGPHC